MGSCLAHYDILLQNVTKVYNKMHRFITKCGSFYKIRLLLKYASVHSFKGGTMTNMIKKVVFNLIFTLLNCKFHL